MPRILPLVVCCFCVWPIAEGRATPAPDGTNGEQLSSDTENPVESGWVRIAGTDESTPVVFSVIDEMAVVEGDILLGRAERVRGHYEDLDPEQIAQSITVTSIGSLWQDGILPYQIHSDIAGGSLPKKIANAIDHIESNSSITMVLRTSENQNQYPDYVEFVSSSGCASHIGKRGGRQSIWLSSACSTGNIIHELGHALGLYHEQARSDRDNYVIIYWENILNGKEHNFQQQLSNATDSGSYDYGSIMHYGKYFFSGNGGTTITTTNPVGATIGQRTGLSDGDTQTLNQLYGADLPLSLQATPALVEPGATITLSAHVTNLLGISARDLVLTVPIPENSAFLGADGNQWSCHSIVGFAVCERDLLLGNANTPLEIYLSAPAYGFPLTLTAQLDSIAFEKASDNNSDSVDVIVNSGNFAPTITPNQAFKVYHLIPNGTSIGRVQANDFNNDVLGEYEIVTGTMMHAFRINPQTGDLSVINNQLWDLQLTPEFILGVITSDGETLSKIGTITIRLLENEAPIRNSVDGGGNVSAACLFVLLLLAGLRNRVEATGREAMICCRLNAVFSMRNKRDKQRRSGIT